MNFKRQNILPLQMGKDQRASIQQVVDLVALGIQHGKDLVLSRFGIHADKRPKGGNVITVRLVCFKQIPIRVVQRVNTVFFSDIVGRTVHILHGNGLDVIHHENQRDGKQDHGNGAKKDRALATLHQRLFFLIRNATHLFFLLTITTTPATRATTAGITVRTTVYWVASAVVTVSMV